MKQFLPSVILLGVVSIYPVNLTQIISGDFIVYQKQMTKNVKDSLQLAIPDFVVVSLNSGSIMSGDFINLNDKTLIIAFRGYTKGILLADIKSIKFESGVLIPINDTVICQQREAKCRKIPQESRPTEGQKTWSDIPLTAFDLAPGAKTALLNRQGILSDEEWQNLLTQSQEMVYIIDQIDITESGSKLTIKATPIARKK